ncbi:MULTISPECIES: sulfite exporter TauE/SafE family protein [unclassified Modicisalibacter]|uniref:sulfite exporter TauE/SafE family protein n=1 Tax=unclassified Modicisalibacter TaxID=2679913 RepID=UPI001CC9002E|nr:MULTISPECIES: sulfite exporter TauE/SafE family protein [unclassified Modicisalibacter]MBZ9560277.1 sulfite exporter TauE/SafE family protein [Modicisalibacter sp. R2A 31.J]MBZ9576186.1 sulfite exporter TauE/SafE family protein [Modicisalibacter sp. MOD 31.J]
MTLPDFSLLAWSLIVISTFFTGVSKGGFAGGFGTLSVPLMALAIGPVEAAGLLLPLLIVMDAFSVKAWWGRQDNREVKRLLPGMAVGVVIGTLTIGLLDEDLIRLLLGIISLLFAAYMLARPAASRAISALWSIPAGIGCGFTSFLAHAGGPPVNLYLIPRRLSKEAFIATSVLAFAAVNLMKLGPYLWLGEIDFTSASASLLLVPVAWAGVRSGLWLQHRVNERLFYRLIILAMAIVGGQLILKALGVV